MPQRIQIRRTVQAENLPASLAQGELAACLGDAPMKLLIGVPTSIDPSGMVDLLKSRVIISATPPSPVLPNAFWWDSAAGKLNIAYQGAWVPAMPAAAAGGAVSFADTPPANPPVGQLWCKFAPGQTNVYSLWAWSGANWTCLNPRHINFAAASLAVGATTPWLATLAYQDGVMDTIIASCDLPGPSPGSSGEMDLIADTIQASSTGVPPAGNTLPGSVRIATFQTGMAISSLASVTNYYGGGLLPAPMGYRLRVIGRGLWANINNLSVALRAIPGGATP